MWQGEPESRSRRGKGERLAGDWRRPAVPAERSPAVVPRSLCRTRRWRRRTARGVAGPPDGALQRLPPRARRPGGRAVSVRARRAGKWHRTLIYGHARWCGRDRLLRFGPKTSTPMAEPINGEVHAVRKSVLGSEHPDALRSAASFAKTLTFQGSMPRLSASTARCTPQESAWRPVPAHPHMLTSACNLASFPLRPRKSAQARLLLEATLEASARARTRSSIPACQLHELLIGVARGHACAPCTCAAVVS